MPEGKSIQFQEGEYPELDGLEAGSSVKFEGEATIETQEDGTKVLNIQSMEFETEGLADRELRNMKGEAPKGSPIPVAGAGEDF